MTNETLPRPINNLAARLLISLAMLDAAQYLAESMTRYFDPTSAMPFHLNDDHLDYNPAASRLLDTLNSELEYIIFHDDDRALAFIAELTTDRDFLDEISALDFNTPLLDFLPDTIALADDDDLARRDARAA